MKRTVLSVLFSVMLLLVGGVLLGGKVYLERTIADKNLAELTEVYRSIPDPTERERESIEIRHKMITKYIAADRWYSGLQDEEGDGYFCAYAESASWEMINVSELDGTRYWHFQKGDIEWNLSHMTGEDRWHMLLIKNDELYKNGY